MRPLLSLLLTLLFIATPLCAQRVAAAGRDSAIEALQAIPGDSQRIYQLLRYARKLEESRPADAIALSRSLTDEARHLHLDALWLRGVMLLGRAYFTNGDYTRSLQYFMQAQKAANAQLRYNEEVEALKGISIIYMRSHDLPKSLRYLKTADSMAWKYSLTARLSDLRSEMGIRYAEARQYDSAIACYREAIAMARQLKQENEEVNALVNMAVSLKNLHRFGEALKIYRHMLQQLQRKGDGEGTAIVTDNIANLYFESGNPIQSEVYALRTLAISDTLAAGRNYVQQDIYTLLTKLYEQRGDYAKAFAASQRLSALKDSLFNEQSAKQLQEASVRFDSELKDSQITAQQAEISLRNRQTIFLAGGILLLLIAGVITYLNQVKVRRLARQVLAQKGELERLNSVKDRIFSAISHDVRTPLSSLFSFSRLLAEGNITAEKLPLYTAQLNGQLSYTMGLMDNLLHWARSQMQGFHPVMELLNIGAVAAEAIEAVAAEAAHKGVDVTQSIAIGAVVKADKQMTALVLRNLIHNAVKYTPRDGNIIISGEAAEGALQLSVTDTGIGIDAATVTAFNKEEPMKSQPGTSGEKGTGLGLLLCKSLAAAMGGRLELCSKPGEGSRFVLVLPAIYPPKASG